MELLEQIKKELKEKKCDCLYVNHTNEFFSEYVNVSRSSRFLLTGFSGSMGDAVVTNSRIFQFADSRYWEQAENEVNSKTTDVLKLGKNLTFEKALCENVKAGSKILMFEGKTSFRLFEKLEKFGFTIELTDTDIVEKFCKLKPLNLSKNFKEIPLSICGKSSKAKIQKLQKKIGKNQVLIVSSLEDVSYLLNMRSDIFEYSSVIFGKIIITKNNYKFFAEEKDFEKALDVIAKKGKFEFLIDKDSLSVKYKKYFNKYVEAKVLNNLRSVKNTAELKHMQKCFERTDKVLDAFKEKLNSKNLRENKLFDYVNQSFKNFGAETNSFKTILASGKNSSIVHFSHPTERKLAGGDFVLLDCGGFYEGGYATDITRTFFYRGNGKKEPTKEQKLVYTIVLKAFLNAYNADLTKYKTCFEIDKIARDLIEKAKKKYNLEEFNFGHGLGHSVGRCVHDGLPTVSPSPLAKMKIKKNMVFTVEPGLYKPNWGGVRLENTIHVVKNEKGNLQLKSFSKAPFQRVLIDFSILSDKEKKYLKEWELI